MRLTSSFLSVWELIEVLISYVPLFNDNDKYIRGTSVIVVLTAGKGAARAAQANTTRKSGERMAFWEDVNGRD